MLAAAFRALGRSLDTARALTLVVSLAGVPAVAAIARRLLAAPADEARGAASGASPGAHLASAAAGLSAAVLLLASPHFYWLSRSVNPDLPAMALAVMGLAVLWAASAVPERARLAPLAAAGVLFGAAASIKLFVGVVGAPALVLLMARARRRPRREVAGETAAVALAAAAVCATWLLAADPPRVWDGAVGAVSAARKAFPSRAMEYATWLMRDNLLGENLGLTALAVLGLGWLARRSRWEAAAMAAWLCATSAALIMQRPMWPRHHWSLVLWPLAILGGVAVGAVVSWLQGSLERGRNNAARGSLEGGRNSALRGGRVWGGNNAARGAVAVGSLALLVWALALPAQLATLAELTSPPQFAAVAYGADWLRANVAPGGKVISDNGLVSFLGGRPMPPEAVPMSSKRIAIGDLTGDDLVRASERDRVAAVLMWNNQLEDFASFVGYLPTRFLHVETVGEDRQIWARFEEDSLSARIGARFPDAGTLVGALVETDELSAVPDRNPGTEPFPVGGVGPSGGNGVILSPGDSVRAGSPITLTLVWRADGAAPADLAAFLHAGGEFSALQADASVGDSPPESWLPDQLVTSRHRLALPPDGPLGSLDLVAGLYTRGDLRRLPARDAAGAPLAGDQVDLFTLEVVP